MTPDLRLTPETTYGDRLLTPEETATLLGVSVRWLYRHAGKFAFTRRLSRKALRFHAAGLRAFIEKGRP